MQQLVKTRNRAELSAQSSFSSRASEADVSGEEASPPTLSTGLFMGLSFDTAPITLNILNIDYSPLPPVVSDFEILGRSTLAQTPPANARTSSFLSLDCSDLPKIEPFELSLASPGAITSLRSDHPLLSTPSQPELPIYPPINPSASLKNNNLDVLFSAISPLPADYHNVHPFTPAPPTQFQHHFAPRRPAPSQFSSSNDQPLVGNITTSTGQHVQDFFDTMGTPIPLNTAHSTTFASNLR